MKKLWNEDWEFWVDTDCGESLPETGVKWQQVTLPHDWQIWHVKNLYQDGTGWYRKRFEYQPEKGSRQLLYFEGVYMDTAVFVNGKLAKEWKYGYTSFWFEITDYLVAGRNEIIVKCSLRHPNSRWYSGAGIYRDVWFYEVSEKYIVPDSIYISAKEKEDGIWSVTVETEITGAGEGDVLSFTLMDQKDSSAEQVLMTVKRKIEKNIEGMAEENKTVGGMEGKQNDGRQYTRECVEKESHTGKREKTSFSKASAEFKVTDPQVWDVNSPYCYTLLVQLLHDGQTMDEAESVCGFRIIDLDPEEGLLLNHKPITLHGVCLHHDLGALGAAFHISAAKRQLAIMKEMGANAIRTAHNPPAPGFMKLADEMGFLVVDEAFDCWMKGKTPYDYGRFFRDWLSEDVESWIKRDRNHPSLLFWSIGNEVYDTHLGEKGEECTKTLIEEVKKHDPEGNGKITFGSNYLAWENTQKCAKYMDAVGYNYGESLYGKHHKEHPEWMIYGSETGSIVQSRGIYHFPLSQSLLVDDDLQCSSLGNSRTSWGAKSLTDCFASDIRYPFSLGQFLWTGLDYLGEPTPYHTKNSYFGQADTAGFEKDAFYFYQAGWHDRKEKTVLHLFPYWDFNPGQLVDVCIISNAPEVELWVNGESMGRKARTEQTDIIHAWQVRYEEGSIRAAAYDGSGNKIAEVEEHSFQDAAALKIDADRNRITNGREELVFCTITAVDKDGHEVKNANNYVTVEVTEPLKLMGLDNGNSTDMEEYKSFSRQLFSGKLLAILSATQNGTGQVKVTSPGLEPASIELFADDKREPQRGILPEIKEKNEIKEEKETDKAKEEKEIGKIKEKSDTPFIPVRKIEMRTSAASLNPSCPEAIIEAKIFPVQAEYRDLEWWITDERGIPVHNAKLEILNEEGSRVKVTGLGDGRIRVRCACRNGKDFAEILSNLEIDIEGMGTMFHNPYEFLSAAFYTKSHGEIGNGNERGITTSRTERSWVSYEGLDFGRNGADTLTISVFEMNNVPTPIRFWKGIPYEEGSRCIGECIYDKPSIWNTYQDETFRLKERLTGQDVFSIELECKVHIKGFVFEEISRAWEDIPALFYDMIYGDSFRLKEDSVEGIGNNVSLVFKNLDFGSEGCRGIAISGRTELSNNSIHIKFENGLEERRQIVEFGRQKDWGEQKFTLEKVYGKWDVTFLFLPGSSFDFRYFRFENSD